MKIIRILGIFCCFMALSFSGKGKSTSESFDFDMNFDFSLTEVETYLNCKEALFTEEQKNQIKEIFEGMKEFKDEVIVNSVADIFKMSRSIEKYKGILSDSNSTKEEAQQSAKALIPLLAEFIQNIVKGLGEKEVELTNEIFYQVATPEQRASIVTCSDEEGEDE